MGGMRDDRDDPDAGRRQQALFRHAIIGELDIEALPRGERSARIAELATRTYRPPGGDERRFSGRTPPGHSGRAAAPPTRTDDGDAHPPAAWAARAATR